jgi:hypothetical protein
MAIKTGTFTAAGTTAAVNISMGFVPQAVILVGRGTDLNIHFWTEDMSNGQAATAANTHANVSTNGMTPYLGGDPTVSSGTTGGAAQGITIGTGCQVASQPYMWIAFGKDGA